MIWPFNTSNKDPEILLRELTSPDQKKRESAFHELIEHQAPETDQLVISALESFSESPRDIILPLIDIAGKRRIREAMPIFKALLKGSESALRESALQALAAISSQESLDIMISCLADPDAGIRQKVQLAISENYGKDSLGAFIKALPDDRNSPLYFEIVALMEDLDLFSVIKENFGHPDVKVKEFYFETLAKFNRPDFISLYLDFYAKASHQSQGKILDMLMDYRVSELIPCFREKLASGNYEGLFELCDRTLISRFNDDKEEVLSFILSMQENRYRLKVLPDLIKHLDPYCFLTALNLLKDSANEIRNITYQALAELIKSTYDRMNNKQEPNKIALAGLYDSWEKLIIASMRDRDLQEEQKKLTRRLFFALCQNRHALIRPFVRELFQKNFHETYFYLKGWEFEEQFNLFEWLISSDPSFGSLLLTALQGNTEDSLWRIVFKLMSSIKDPEEQESFRRNLISRNRNISVEKFLRDPDQDVRKSAIDFASECKLNGLLEILKSATKDPSPAVRVKALKCLEQQHSPQLQTFLIEALNDPDETVALFALEKLREKIEPHKLAPLLVRFINSSSEKLRTFALSQIADLTKARYKANFNNLKPEIRKLAAKVIQKIDNNFSDQIVNDLSSLDPQTRLQAALLLENIQLDDKGKDALLAAMKDPSKLVRAAVVKTLGVIGDADLIKHLISFCNDPDARVRANTVEAISSLGDRQAIQILLPYVEDSNNRIRANAIVGIRKIGNFNVMPILQKMLSNKDINMRASGLWAIGEIGDANYINFVFPFLSDKNELLRFNAIKAASRINPQILSQYLPVLRKDTSAKIRKLVSELSYKVI